MTDSELVNLIKNEDPRGLSRVYEAYRKEFVHWMMKLRKCDTENARDYYQAAILILYENIVSGKLGELQSSLKTYLFGIGKNLARQQHRKTLRQHDAGAEFYVKNYILNDEDESVMNEHNLELVREQFNSLGEPCHGLLSQYYFERRSMEEISEVMGYKNPDTAKNQKYKCMERLRKMVFAHRNGAPQQTKPIIEEE